MNTTKKIVNKILGNKKIKLDKYSLSKKQYTWKCDECGQIVITSRDETPLPLRWKDGHVCKFKKQ